ncbi:Tetratricopeptide repeat family [Favolaschia claudopus]|uniref:Tetratricopeptide repeat family n=1 Tax=Favolaschia claudopus TaxID=2862362 RepID=A0AAW0AZ41_9AGAR
MDPITITATIITLGTFIKDLIELGEGIRSSIEEVGENRRQLRDLTQDILRTLYELANLTRGKEAAFRGPELLGSLESLKAEMLSVHSKCLKISPKQLPGFRGIPSHLKAWVKRDDLKKQIGRLRERVQKCLSQFTTFSAARTEHLAAQIAHRTLRIEQRLIVDNVENQVKARRLEGLMARVMLDSEFGQGKLRETVETISADSSFQSLEYQYMSAQLRSLINLVKPLLAEEDMSLFQGWKSDTLSLVMSERSLATPLHALSHILGIIVAINSPDYASLLDLLKTAVDKLPACFSRTAMHSEAIVWGHFEVDLHRYMVKRGGCNIGTLPRMAHALGEISRAHRCRFELDAAIELSQESLDLWVELSHLLPEEDNRIGYLAALVIHATNLLEKDDKTNMLSAAQDAVSLARPMAKALAESLVSRGTSLTAEEQSNASDFCDAFFVLAQVLSSLDRPLDSYEAFLDASRTVCSLPIWGYDYIHWGEYIDSFLDVICKVAEDGRLSLSMLSDCVDLFHSLAHIYPKQFSSGFLHILHAFAYHSQQPHSYHSMEQLRLFLEPTHDAAPPAIRTLAPIPTDLNVLADAMRLCFTYVQTRENCTIPLVHNILVAHFPQAIEALRVVVQSPVFDISAFQWILHTARDILPHLSAAKYVDLLQLLVETVKCKSSHAIQVLESLNFDKWKMHFTGYFYHVCQEAIRLGVVDEGISFCQELAACVEAKSDAHPGAVVWSRDHLEHCVVLLFDAARFRDAVNLIKGKGSRFPEFGDLGPGMGDLTLCVLKVQILQHVGRYKEALRLVRSGVAEGTRRFWVERPTFDLLLYFLLSQLAWAWQQMGRPAKALEHAEKAATICCDVEDGTHELEEKILHVQIHSLTIHSNCLAAVGRIDEGLVSARKAVSLYTEHYKSIWKYFFYTIRAEELVGNAFLALSLRLLTADDKEEALLYGLRATEIYRKLVALAPRHLPTLARSLQHLASIVWLLGQQLEDEAIAASEEAVDILRKVVDPETYFLPLFADALDELAGYLSKRGDSSGASSATAEAAAARLKFASLPSEPEWLFMQAVDADENDDLNWWEWDAQQYRDAPEGSATEDSADDADESGDAGDPELEAEQTAAVGTPEGKFSPIIVPPENSAVQPSFKEFNDMGNSETSTAGETAKGSAIQGTFTNILSKPVEIRLSVRSTPMDILWWTLLLLPAVLFAVMYARLVQDL